MDTAETTLRSVTIEGLRLSYRELGEGVPVLLLHGWPTSSFLWRNVMPAIAAAGRRAVALDLPGFGRSEKPLDASYSFRFFERAVGGFVDHLGAERIGLAVHDLGGPVGLYWAGLHCERVERLALLNTLIYPEMSWAVIAFVMAVKLPLVRSCLTSPTGLRWTLRLGVHDRRRLSEETLRSVVEPFPDAPSRRVLARAGGGLSPKGLRDLAERLRNFDCPVRVVYGERDRILPDVARTMARVKADLPQAEVTALADCGHFLQEERPEEVGGLLGQFFAA